MLTEKKYSIWDFIAFWITVRVIVMIVDIILIFIS